MAEENRRSSSSASSSSSYGEASVRIEQEIGAGTSSDGKELETKAVVATSSSVNNNGCTDTSSGTFGRDATKLNTSKAEMPGANKLEPTSSGLKLERSKTERQRPNILAEEAAQIFDDKIPVQQKLKLLNRIATVKDDGTVEFDVPGDVAPQALSAGSDDVYNAFVDDEPVDATDLQYIPPLQIVMLIVGTRGDVQPFIAIGKRLQDYGHRVRLATHSNFKEFVLTAGLEFFPLGGDPKVLAGYMVKNKGFLPSGPSEIPTQRNQLKDIINSLLPACKEPDMDSGIPFKADAIIANPPAYVSVVNQFMHNPSDRHMNAVNRILAYLKSSPGKGIMFSKHGHLDIMGYTDSDFAGSNLDRKSTSGYVSFVGGNLVTWRSKKQNVVSLSSAEAEYRALHHATTELAWLKILLKELGFGPKKPMVLYCDNTAAIEIANNPVQHDRTKHIEVDRNYIKDNLDSGMIEVPYIKSADQLADMMTHAVTSGSFYASLSKLGMCDIYAPT
ncbi:sterol 3-beta-glucosyltransferase UGT80A2 isoform X3 [Ricinus communis]|uniref:sterol 3-beta-glucosyltransferase UGT80A2 isoform X3 n=1 Tax=Ricinus communis TaxID=3988 RepID=UPI00201A4CDD|nr:sterol 3-beta-glucosyltransferase UGT80A2 isoform X3 [Ricinus communis]